MEPLEPDSVQSETGSAPRSQAPPPPNNNEALPPELLLLVFDSIHSEWIRPLLYPCPGDEVTTRPLRHPLSDAMLVCRAWRNLVVDSPQYWTTVDVLILESSPEGTEQSWERTPESAAMERYLKRSGDLPIRVNIGSSSEMDLEPIFDRLRSQEHRWQALNLFQSPTFASIHQSQLRSLFSIPLPSLTSLHVGPFYTWLDSGDYTNGTWFQVDAPNLCELSCELNFVLPHSTSSLKFLSLTLVFPEPRVGEPRFELGGLVELRILACDAMPFLSMFSTPTLCRLVIDGRRGALPPPGSLPQYQHLKEFKWADNNLDLREQFNMIALLCPNITSFANYLEGREEQQLIEHESIFRLTPVLLREECDIRVNRRGEKCLWPNLEEILLTSATCAEIAELIDALPSVHRVRVLNDPITLGGPETQMKERHLMERLRERVNIALWLEPWSDRRSLSDRD